MGEADENKLIQGSEAMITNLTWNLALVTCRDPLKLQIQQNLMNQFAIQTNMVEDMKRQMSEQLSQINIKIACDIVKKIVIEKALNEIKNDSLLQQEIEIRRNFKDKKNFVQEKLDWLRKELPDELNPFEIN